ncbi:MAG: hypothetical protein J7M20_08805 [Deltaproteobacteria bacterium]|nr:hypothetical protein [Deltaproteobacteria bacterium]
MDLTDLLNDRIGEELAAPIAVAGMKEVNYAPIYGKHFGILNVILKVGPHGLRAWWEIHILGTAGHRHHVGAGLCNLSHSFHGARVLCYLR